MKMVLLFLLGTGCTTQAARPVPVNAGGASACAPDAVEWCFEVAGCGCGALDFYGPDGGFEQRVPIKCGCPAGQACNAGTCTAE